MGDGARAIESQDFFDRTLDFQTVLFQQSPDWLVDGLFPRVGCSMIYGPENSGKTLLLVAADTAIRSGLPFLGHRTHRAATLFLAGEGATGLGERYRACLHQYKVDLDLDLLEPLRLLPEAIMLDDAEEVTRLIRTARQQEAFTGVPVGAVIIDSFIEFIGGEETGEGMARASRGIRTIARELDCCVLIGHHPNAAGQDRGSRHLSFRVESRFKLETSSDTDRWLVCEKQRHGPRLAIDLTLDAVKGSVVFRHVQTIPAAEYAKLAGPPAAAHASSKKLASSRAVTAWGLLSEYIEANPETSKSGAIKGCKRHGIGDALLRDTLEDLIADGHVLVRYGSNSTQHLRINPSPPAHTPGDPGLTTGEGSPAAPAPFGSRRADRATAAPPQGEGS
jgi:hypothetical protein